MTDLDILISRKAGSDLHELAENLGWSLTDIDTLHIEYIPLALQPTATGKETWIVSSRHGALALADAFDQDNSICQRVICVGNRTREKLEGRGIRVHIAANSARELINAISDLPIEEARFFCGSSRRNEIPDGLKQRTIRYTEEIVYRSIPLNPTLSKLDFTGLVGTSPMSVESLLKNNSIPRDIPCIAIGQTSMEYMQSLGMTDIMVSSFPRLETAFVEFNTYLRNGAIEK